MGDIRARFGAALKAWRTRRQLTQEELAERSGLSYKFIGEIERGTGNPTIETVSHLALALDVDIGQLFSPESDWRLSDVYRLTRRDVQKVREAAESLDSVMRRFTPKPDARYRRPRRRK